MSQSSDPLSAALPQPRAQQIRPTRGPPASSGWLPAGCGAAGTAGPPRELPGERDRIAKHLTDVVGRGPGFMAVWFWFGCVGVLWRGCGVRSWWR